MDQDGQLDITSESLLGPQTPRAVGTPKSSPGRAGKRVRLYFRCCRVVALLVPPAPILSGQLSVWRVHCPRCARLGEIAVEE